MAGDHETLGQLEVENADLRYRNNILFTRVERLEEQVRNLMLFRAVAQHGPGNPIVVEDDDDEVEIVEDSEISREVEIRDMTPGELVREITPVDLAGRLILIEEVVADQEVWEDKRAFRRDWLTEDVNPVPEYPEPPKYVPPPIYDE